ncbi:MAG: S8 family serine peptidase [Acidobacteria bacterium]|nr:S8 family serine peptidase [Acidobacteriota bacterium]
MKRFPFLALFLLTALLCGITFLPQLSGAQAQKRQPQPRPSSDKARGADPAAAAAAAQGEQFQVRDSALRQLEALKSEKLSRTPAQRKLDSQLIYALKERRGDPLKEAVPSLQVNVAVDARGYTLVDIRAAVTKQVLATIRNAGGEIVSSFKRAESIRADVPVDALELIATMGEVKSIRPADEFMLNKAEAPAKGGADARPRADANSTLPTAARPGFAERAEAVRARLAGALFGGRAPVAAADENEPVPNVGAANSQGDTTHNARLARNFFGINGKGIKIGIISDSFNAGGGYNADIASGDLPGPGNPNGYTTPVTIEQDSSGTDEGRAMAQIVHDLVPGAQLFFATANGGVANFAQNILDLRNTHGCDIIVDDVSYFTESPFQNDAIGNAVDAVMAGGGLYFSSVGNSGNLNDNTSGVWEGDYVDSGALTVGTAGTLQHVHDFDPTAAVAQFDTITLGAGNSITLYWSDPLGASNNDYDLYVLNSTGTSVVSASANDQTGTQNPFEASSGGANATGNRVVVDKFSGSVRFLHLNTNRGRLAQRTAGQARGHAATSGGYAVAATPAVGPFPGTHSAANAVETFSSDGLRRLFYQGDGAEITPGDRTATGGAVKQKPEITAADGVATTVPGFSAFFGTSAAAPHAAAIAALLKASSVSPTAAQVLAALNATAIDIEAAGIDRDSGVGIVMPHPALQNLGAAPGATLELGTVTVAAASGCDALLNPGEKGTLTVNLSNVGGAGATAVSATLTSSTPGVTVVQSTSPYPNIPASGARPAPSPSPSPCRPPRRPARRRTTPTRARRPPSPTASPPASTSRSPSAGSPARSPISTSASAAARATRPTRQRPTASTTRGSATSSSR